MTGPGPGRAPLLRVWDNTATVTRDGIQPGDAGRRIEMTPTQLTQILTLLTHEEMVAFSLFLTHMRPARHPAGGEKMIVAGWGGKWLVAHGMTAYAARKASTGLVRKGILTSEWAPGTEGVPNHPRWVCLSPDLVGTARTTTRVRRVRGDDPALPSSAPPAGTLPVLPSYGNTGTPVPEPVDNPVLPSYGNTGTPVPEPVDNPVLPSYGNTTPTPPPRTTRLRGFRRSAGM